MNEDLGIYVNWSDTYTIHAVCIPCFILIIRIPITEHIN